jgi:hypothetical protein
MKAGWRTKTTLSVLGMVPHYRVIKRTGGSLFSVVIFDYLQGLPDQLLANACSELAAVQRPRSLTPY